MTSTLLALTCDAHNPRLLASFWSGVLGCEIVDETGGGTLLPGSPTQVGLRFVLSHSVKSGPNPVHLHLTSTSLDAQQETVVAALALGAVHIDVGQRPDEGFVVLADPEGNEFCVIEPGNGFLTGCGFLGEIACDGTRRVGLFWAAALGWPLVWDQDGETAVQSPDGGTKVAWSGTTEPKSERNRQRLDLTTVGTELADEIERLVALGAAELGSADGGAVTLADPDGNEFRLIHG